ncbi:hypothetical protein FSP39_015028 [Pinctada imbricata]|uniref:P/Homo B domain-containing protein n=1 Tax=Pinctada imbricata TaxID=66713 RepID=A0AA89BXG4_PINIB|nr:hypothetical protein FSP39_015028 [Pinctada imbricata]
MRYTIFLIQLSVLEPLFFQIVFAAEKQYCDIWAVRIDGDEDYARSLAKKHNFIYKGQIMPGYYSFQHRKVAKRSIHPSSFKHRTLAQEPNVRWLEQQIVKKRVKRDIHYHREFYFNDPKWPRAWYLNRGQGLDMNVRDAWKEGVTGKNVVVTILDDGIEKDHPDLEQNYDPMASFDVNNHDADPQPRYDFSNENRHGTRCAGEVAAQANNHICNVGVAYNARIGGVRMLDGDVTDSVEAQSLSLHTQHIHIYSASWGPDDDGRTVDGPATLARKAFYDGITKGRGGLGSIFVWASGNGGRDGDSCNCDGYTNSIYTLSISSATEYGNVPWYSEACSSTLATTYSSGSGGEKQIVTTDLRKVCTENHTGTSASAPLAAGICALALEANPGLTWRDMQHIVVQTARKANLKAPDWIRNGVGRMVSHSFGFGLMDAGAMVRLARNWTTVPKQHVCEIRSEHRNRAIGMNDDTKVFLYTDGCEGTGSHVKYLEHVVARITLTASRRGEIQIFLTSPMSTRSTLLARRTRDTSREGFNNWAFMTTHNWGEIASGTWVLEIRNGASSFRGAKLKDWVLVLYGTDVDPQERTTVTPLLPSRSSTLTRRKKDRNNAQNQNWFNFGTTTSPQMFPGFEIMRPKVRDRYPNFGRHEKYNTELKEWTLKMMGTETHPQGQNISHTLKSKQNVDCRGSASNSPCIECILGYYKHKNECVQSCPNHYYPDMETVVNRDNKHNISKTPLYQRYGVCNKCHSACKTCKGPFLEDCFQCNEGYEVRQNYCRKKLIMNFLDPDMLSFFVWVIILCTSAILLFGVVFIILQARDHRILCWKEKRHFDEDKGKYNGVNTILSAEEQEGDTEQYRGNVVRNIHYRADDNDFSINFNMGRTFPVHSTRT